MLISVKFNLDYGTSFRHQNSFGESGVIPILFFLISAFSKNFILFFAILSSYPIKIPKKLKIINLISSICLLIGFNGSLDVIFIIIGFLLIINPNLLARK